MNKLRSRLKGSSARGSSLRSSFSKGNSSSRTNSKNADASSSSRTNSKNAGVSSSSRTNSKTMDLDEPTGAGKSRQSSKGDVDTSGRSSTNSALDGSVNKSTKVYYNPKSGKSDSRDPRKAKKEARRAIENTDDANFVLPVIPKSDIIGDLILGAIAPNVLFRACTKEELTDLVESFEPVTKTKGSIVIHEGGKGDGFYVLSSGSVSVFEQTEYKTTMSPGSGFGEIALLYSCPRTATVRAEEDCKLWFMDRRAFRVIKTRHKRKRMNIKLMLLEKVKIHDKTLGEILKPAEIRSVAMAAQFQTFNSQEIIVRQGEKGDAFYMIEEGLVDVYIAAKPTSAPVATLKKGDFFGEKALLSSDVRTATCVASHTVRCLMLGREDFVRMLGDLNYLLERSYSLRTPVPDGSTEKAGGIRDTNVHPNTDQFNKSDFDIKRTLGVGAYGYVKLVKWNKAPSTNNTDVLYALKCVSKQLIEEKKQHHKIKREQDIMTSLVHPFIARCFTVMEDFKGKYFLMEALCGGELCELLYFEQRFSEEWSMFYSASVLAGFACMHEKKVAYRDLKPENLVLDTAGYVKIVDFGLAKVIKSGHTYTFCGTPDYLAPEVILSEGHDWAVDYWGLGVLIYEMMEGVAPFYAEAPMDTYRKALSGHVHIPDHFTVVVANLIKKLLHTDQSKRLGRTVGGTTAIMCHRWYSNFDWDALLECRLETPFTPEVKDPDDPGDSEMDGDVEGFATDFL